MKTLPSKSKDFLRNTMNRIGPQLQSLVLLTLVVSCLVAKPNIIFILADDLGYGDIGAFGQEVLKTPRIDQMA